MPLLEGLRGHQLTLLVGGHEVAGKLIIPSPVTLVGPGGQAIVITGMIQSVQF
jgi:hypothetical protein